MIFQKPTVTNNTYAYPISGEVGQSIEEYWQRLDENCAALVQPLAFIIDDLHREFSGKNYWRRVACLNIGQYGQHDEPHLRPLNQGPHAQSVETAIQELPMVCLELAMAFNRQ